MIASLSEEIEEAKIEKASETAGRFKGTMKPLRRKNEMKKIQKKHEDVSKIFSHTTHIQKKAFISRSHFPVAS